MISRLLYSFQHGITYLRQNPQLAFVLVLMFVVPLLFLYTGQQFLDVSRANQDRLQKDRVGLLHDAFVSILYASNFSTTTMQVELERITTLNPDILDFSLAKLESGELLTLAGVTTEQIGVRQPYADFYRGAAVRTDESLIFEAPSADGRVWLAYRALEPTPGEFYFMYTQFTLAPVDALFAAREQTALFSLIYVYVFLMALAYWHVRMQDYRYLYKKAERTIALRDQFTNMIAHELRAPLTAMRGYASMVEEMSDETPIHEARFYATRVRDSSDRLLAIVNDLLDVARIQAGKLPVLQEVTNVTPVVIAVVDELQVSAAAKNISLIHAGTTEVHEIMGDSKRLHQALINLVSNAIKYTKHGSIELSVEEKIKTVEIRIKDTGAGISHEDQQKLFAPFFRVAADDASAITGSGLGMWITKQFVELMGGKVAVESIKGVGTHLVVILQKEPRQRT